VSPPSRGAGYSRLAPRRTALPPSRGAGYSRLAPRQRVWFRAALSVGIAGRGGRTLSPFRREPCRPVDNTAEMLSRGSVQHVSPQKHELDRQSAIFY
jgi:hypothetical protein